MSSGSGLGDAPNLLRVTTSGLERTASSSSTPYRYVLLIYRLLPLLVLLALSLSGRP